MVELAPAPYLPVSRRPLTYHVVGNLRVQVANSCKRANFCKHSARIPGRAVAQRDIMKVMSRDLGPPPPTSAPSNAAKDEWGGLELRFGPSRRPGFDRGCAQAGRACRGGSLRGRHTPFRRQSSYPPVPCRP